MKKLYWIPAFLILLFVGDRLAGLVLSKLVEQANFRYSKLYSQENGAAEILTVGNSRGLMYYQPSIEEITGHTTLNLSYNGLPSQAASVLVQDHLDKYPAPSTVLFEITCADRKNLGLVSGFNSYVAYSPRLAELIKDNSVNSYYGGQLSHLFRYNSEITQRTLRYLKNTDKYWLNDRTINDYLIKNAANEIPLDWTFAEAVEKEEFNADELIEDIVAVVNYAKSKNIDLKLIINPYFPPFINTAKGFEEWKSKVRKATGEKIYDYSLALTDPSYFADYQHTNKKGSAVFMKLLQADGLLPQKK